MKLEEPAEQGLWRRAAGRLVAISLRTWLTAGAVLVLLFTAYLLAGFYLVPSLIRSQGTAWVKTNLDKSLALGAVRFNPLSFTLDASDIAIPGSDGPMVALGHLRLRFSILSLFQSAYHVTEVTLDRPFIHAVIRPDGSLNLIELEPRTHSEGPSPAVRISNLSVNDGRITYADQSRGSQAEETLAPITFTLQDFQTNEAQGGAFTLNAKSTRDEAFVWTGHLSIAPISSQGRLKIAGLRSDTVQKFLGDRLPVTLTAGTAGLTADYDFGYGPGGMRLNLSLPEVALAGLSLTGRGAFNGSASVGQLSAHAGPIVLTTGKDGIVQLTATMPGLQLQGFALAPPGAGAGQDIKLAGITLTDAKLDYGARKMELGNLTLDGADAYLRREKDGKLNLMAMMPQEGSATAPVNAPPSQPWSISLAQFALNGATLRLEDQAVTPAMQMTVTPLTLTATGAGSDLSQPVTLHLEAHMGGKASLTADGVMTPATRAGDVKFTLAGLPLPAFAAYMPAFKGLALKSGAVTASGTAHVQGADMTALSYRGDAVIDDFDIQETTTNSPLFAWRSFAFKGVDLRKNNLEVAAANLVQPLGRVAVLADRSFNFTSLMPPAAAATAIPIQAAPASAKKSNATPTFRIKRLDIAQGVMGFADYSMQPNFEARIDALKGSITNITNRPDEVATIDLDGQVIDQFAPATIKGTMDLLGYARKTDMSVAFHNIELPVFNPYSGRYAGYAIAKGKLTTELHYKIDNRVLNADHHVIIDQLEWGQATDSKEAVPLPVRLATALLRDKNGVIDLDLPVTGSLDDPKFRIWPIIWQIVGNVIEKAVTAPFQLIGSLFAGADKAQYVDFVPGSADLPQGSADALAALAKGLDQRPGLKLDIPAGPGLREDAVQLAETAINTQLLAKDKGKVTDVAALDPDEVHDRLEDLYRAKLGKRPAFPEFSADALKAAPGAKADAGDDDRRTILEAQWMRSELRTAFLPGTAELAALGTARATAVRNALLANNSIDPERVFMATDLTVAATDGHARLELKLE